MTTSVTIVKDDLQALADRINDEYGLAESDRASAIEHAQTAMQHALATGHLLIEAKSKVKHGEWMAWLSANTNVPQRTANKWMILAQNGPEANLGVNEALRLLAEPKKRQADEPATDAPDLPSHPGSLRLVPPVNGLSPSAPVIEHEAVRPAPAIVGKTDMWLATQMAEALGERIGDLMATYPGTPLGDVQRAYELVGMVCGSKVAEIRDEIAEEAPTEQPEVPARDAALVDERRIPGFPDMPNDPEEQVDYLHKLLSDELLGAAQKADWCGNDDRFWPVQVSLWERMALTCKERSDHFVRQSGGLTYWPWDDAPDEWLAEEVAATVDEEIERCECRFRTISMENVASAYRRIADHCTYKAELNDQFIAEDAAEREREATPAEETSTEPTPTKVSKPARTRKTTGQ